MNLQFVIRMIPLVVVLPMATPTAYGLEAGVENLRITEVEPLTRRVEVTHIGNTPFSTTSRLPICHRFNYASAIPPATTPSPGESKVFDAAYRLEFRPGLSPDSARTESNQTVSNITPQHFLITIPDSISANEFFRINGP